MGNLQVGICILISNKVVLFMILDHFNSGYIGIQNVWGENLFTLYTFWVVDLSHVMWLGKGSSFSKSYEFLKSSYCEGIWPKSLYVGIRHEYIWLARMEKEGHDKDLS